MDDNGVGAPSNLSNKVLTVAVGEAHTLALSGDGRVYTWGRGMFGRLGTGSETNEFFPIRVKFDTSQEKKLNFVGIAAGAYHSLALTDDGSVWCWGYNIYGQLGMNDEFCVVPRLMEPFLVSTSPDSITAESETKKKEPLKVCSVKAGGMMSLAIDNLGILWMWGNCPQNRITTESVSTLESTFTPVPVRDFYGHTVVKVACGNEHVIALVSSGETFKGEDLICYSWGDNNHGQLGLGDKESRVRPEIVETFNHASPCAVYEVACGAYHTALLSVKKSPNDKIEYTCWTFGLGGNGQLGHGTTQSAVKPEPVKELPHHSYLISVDCGLFHTSVVSSTGDVWSWGMMNGLGLCPDASFTGTDAGDAISPRKITGLERSRFHEPVQIGCGAAHTVLVANGGYKLWSWGRGNSGALGNGKTMDILAPSLLLWPPLTEDFKDQDLSNVVEGKLGNEGSEDVGETEKRLALAMEEMKLLQSKLSIMERYASILHGSIFGKPFAQEDIPSSLRNEGTFDIAKEWEEMLESVDCSKLIRLELFYQNMLAGVKDKKMKRRIQEMIKELLPPSSSAKQCQQKIGEN